MELPRIECRRAAGLGPVTADPAAWEGLPSAPLVDAISGEAPRQQTRVRTAWDEDALRVFFHVEDDDIRATMRSRDMPLYEEEVVEVFIDPVGDGRGYFEMELNPLGAELDLVLRRTQSGYRKDFGWRCEGMETAAVQMQGGWRGEFRIPFASLGSIQPGPGAAWRVNFLRIDRPSAEERELSAWSPTGIANFHVPQRFGWLDFIG